MWFVFFFDGWKSPAGDSLRGVFLAVFTDMHFVVGSIDDLKASL